MKLGIVVLIISVLILPLLLMGCEEKAGEAYRGWWRSAKRTCTPSTMTYCSGDTLVTKTTDKACKVTRERTPCPFGCSGGECKPKPPISKPTFTIPKRAAGNESNSSG